MRLLKLKNITKIGIYLCLDNQNRQWLISYKNWWTFRFLVPIRVERGIMFL